MNTPRATTSALHLARKGRHPAAIHGHEIVAEGRGSSPLSRAICASRAAPRRPRTHLAQPILILQGRQRPRLRDAAHAEMVAYLVEGRDQPGAAMA